MSDARATRWLIAIALSAAVHGAIYAALPYLTRPDQPEAQPTPQTRARIQAMRVAQSRAEAAQPDSRPLSEERPTGQSLAGGGVPSGRAEPIVPGVNSVAALDASAPVLAGFAPRPAAAAQGTIRAEPVANIVPDAAIAATLSAPVIAAKSVNLPTATLGTVTTAVEAAQAVRLSDQLPTSALRPAATQVALVTPDAPTTKARPAWQFGDRVVSDPSSLAVIQAFLPGADLDESATDLRDDLSSTLTGVDCARISAEFDIETGTLQLSGHVPSPNMRGPVLAAMQAQVGDGIRVAGDLLHLPRPQCGALAGIAAAGLPQSTDQFTDARLVGQAAHAREYRYSAGQRLGFELTAPDYPAYVYVDFFDADGQVIHLVPNNFAPLELHPAQSLFDVGRSGDLNITIGPPFGQEIAVAFAASRPLYDGLRPIREPADAYLDFMKAQIAAARAEDPDFKGEWVYFFVTTRAAVQ